MNEKYLKSWNLVALNFCFLVERLASSIRGTIFALQVHLPEDQKTFQVYSYWDR